MKNKILILSLGVALISACVLTGCGASTQPAQSQQQVQQTSQTRTVTLPDGSQVTVPQKVERVATINGPAYEKLVVLDAEDKIVCVADSHKVNWPWSNVIFKDLNKLPAIANANTALNVEDLVPYHIDVTFIWVDPKATAAMQNIGISVVAVASTKDPGSVKEELKTYAEVLGGDAPAKAKKYTEYFDKKLKMITDVTSKIPQSERPIVHFAMRKVLATSGNKTTIPALVESAGGNCVESKLDAGSTEVTKEQLISWNPDYIFVDHATTTAASPDAQTQVKKLLAEGDYSKVTAVKNKNVYIAPTGVMYWDASLQRILLVMWMAKTMYPDKFANLNMVTELQEFYSQFYHFDLTSQQAQKILDHVDP